MEDQNLQQLQYSNQINFSAHPPCIIAWFIVAIDHICIHLGCSNWRNILPEKSTVEGSWFSNEQKLIKSPSELMPRLMTYQEYLEIQIDVEINMYTDIDHIEPYSFTSMKQFAFHTSSTNLGAINSWTSLLVYFGKKSHARRRSLAIKVQKLNLAPTLLHTCIDRNVLKDMVVRYRFDCDTLF